MTELEWLLKESGITAEEWKAYEAIGQTSKLLGAIKKALGLSEQAIKDKVEAENARLAFEKRYNDEFVPEMRKVTQDALRAQGEAAAMKARLDKAREYGIVPDDEPARPAAGGGAAEPPRAPGSPAPTGITQDAFDNFSRSQSNTIIALNDLNAEHFRLFGAPLGNTQELVEEVNRQRTLGHKNYTLRNAWETKHNVEAKRAEIAAAARKKETDEAVAAALKAEREKQGANPNVRAGATSRFSTYKPSDAAGTEPWKLPRQVGERNRPWREKAVAKVREAMAA